jgi:protein-S-isoprenylcysteine O-methyltransferase Ste14
MRGIVLPSIGSFVFFVIAPGTVAGWVPWLISRWTFDAPFFGLAGTRVIGVVVTGLGVAILVDCFSRFAIQGRGTPAPVLPTERLVVRGLYRHVRNPMYLGVVSTILGQAMLFGERSLLWYGALVWFAFHAFVLCYEEPTLRTRYGGEYEMYLAAVRRWLPRLKPWQPRPS